MLIFYAIICICEDNEYCVILSYTDSRWSPLFYVLATCLFFFAIGWHMQTGNLFQVFGFSKMKAMYGWSKRWGRIMQKRTNIYLRKKHFIFLSLKQVLHSKSRDSLHNYKIVGVVHDHALILSYHKLVRLLLENRCFGKSD